MLVDGRIVLCLVTISGFIPAKGNSFQDLSDFKLLNDGIEQEAALKFKENSDQFESPQTPSNSSNEHDKSNTNTNLLGSKESEELGMDTVTLIWYLTTFTALFGFFIVMACTENTCNRRINNKPAERRNATPSPCPSYKHFAPPTYASVMKKLKDPKVFIVPVHEGNNNFFTNPADVPQSTEKNETVVTVSR